ncbi:hypothetical protein KP509_22G068800 [Ceratopteris richardii]|uniref:Uncharacterized protein n=1 Tax=Ceratopteris richardii TaxID=49495 RepID=A0A8T2S831_CERRI|nr:hypothetical protein KP509_22G068800 [Ceratopteris richardii]
MISTFRSMLGSDLCADKKAATLSMAGSRQTDFGRSHVLVLGDSPLQRLTTQKRRAQPLYRKYNHYDDGRGWWDEEMVGMEELGTTYEWEGVASMSFGSTTTPASP